jgi:hypothetical protein
VFATGIALLLVGPAHRDTLMLLHKVSFICWVVVTAVHTAGHLPEMLRFNAVSRRTRVEISALRAQIPGFGGEAEPPPDRPVPGAAGRWISVCVALALGLALAVAFIPQFSAWTHP